LTREDFLVEDYKLAVDHLSAQYERLWQRFNFFLTVHMALFGVAGWLYLEKDEPRHEPLVALAALVLSGLWYAVGAQDRFLVEVYRERVGVAAERIARIEELQLPDFGRGYVGAAVPRAWRGFSSWFLPSFGVTHMPVWVATGLFVVWTVILALSLSCAAA
jgi:hypothetical protein